MSNQGHQGQRRMVNAGRLVYHAHRGLESA